MKKTKLPSLISILILTLLTSVVWVSLGVYRAFSVKPAPVVSQEISSPIIPSLDTTTINQVESKMYPADSQIPEIALTPGGSNSTTIVIPKSTPIASASATPKVIPTPTSASGSAATP